MSGLHHGGNCRVDQGSESPDPRLASMPKGTLPLRHMTGRADGYRPESVETYDTRRNMRWAPEIPSLSIASQFYTPRNRLEIVNAVVSALNKNNKGEVSADMLPVAMVDECMRRSFEVFGETVGNAPQARTGPSESLPWLAPASKYQDDYHDGAGTVAGHASDLEKLNKLAARRLQEQIVSERALLSRYQRDLGGAIQVLEYPRMQPVEYSRHKPLLHPYYEDITSEPGDGSVQSKMYSGPAFGGKRYVPPKKI